MTLEELGYKLIEKEGKYYYNGDLFLKNTGVTSLPDNLIVVGFLDLRDTKITSLPDNLIVCWYFDLRDTEITSLPDNLVVGYNLYLCNTNISTLPNNLIVGGSLNLSRTDITSLPDNLTIGGDLIIRETDITLLPDDLIVGDNIYFDDSKVTEEDIDKVNHNVPKILFWGNKEYASVGLMFYKVISNYKNIYEISYIGTEKIYHLITNSDYSKYIIYDNLSDAKKMYNLLNIKKNDIKGTRI